MSPVILIPKFDRALRAAEPTGRKNGRNAKTTADYRRFLSELKHAASLATSVFAQAFKPRGRYRAKTVPRSKPRGS